MTKLFFLVKTLTFISNLISKIHIRNNAKCLFKRKVGLELKVSQIILIGNSFINLPEANKLEKISSGTNHHVFQYEELGQSYLIKIASQKKSIRLRKEFLALIFLNSQAAKLAPNPITIFKNNENLYVLIAEWIKGKIYQKPPQQDTEWKQIIEHYLHIHSISPTLCNLFVQYAYHNPRSKQKSSKMIYGQLRKVPKNIWPSELTYLLELWEEETFNNWSSVKEVFCRGDGNYSNFIFNSEGIISVDWEFSGWGDPHFDFASLLAHPAYVDRTLSQTQWATEYYCGLVNQKEFIQKINDCLFTLYIYWASRYLNLLHNTDPKKPYKWKDRSSLRQENYEKYVKRANEFLPQLKRKLFIS